MDEKQQIAFLQATVSLQKERLDKLEARVEDIETQFGVKLDLLISQSNFLKGISKAIGGLITALTIASPFIVKHFMG